MNTLITSMAQANSGGGGADQLLRMIVPFALIFVLFYFLFIRPQKKKEQERLKMLQNIQKNDRVLTSSGIYGIIVGIKDNEVTLRIDEKNDVKIRLARSAVIAIEKSKEEPVK
ncbi:MAG: preprotein translocase subunit YajC [Planctomycetota bacterium]